MTLLDFINSLAFMSSQHLFIHTDNRDEGADEWAARVEADQAAMPRLVVTSKTLGCAVHEQPEPGTVTTHPQQHSAVGQEEVLRRHES